MIGYNKFPRPTMHAAGVILFVCFFLLPVEVVWPAPVTVSVDGRTLQTLGATTTLAILSTTGGAALYQGLTTDQVQDLQLEPGTTYVLQVTSGGSPAGSFRFKVTGPCTLEVVPVDTTPPSAPTNLRVL